jgi:hypothetical protein
VAWGTKRADSVLTPAVGDVTTAVDIDKQTVNNHFPITW